MGHSDSQGGGISGQSQLHEVQPQTITHDRHAHKKAPKDLSDSQDSPNIGQPQLHPLLK